MSPAAPRVGVPFVEPSAHPDLVEKFGGEPVPIRIPRARPAGGVALVREWISDMTQISCAGEDLDGLLLIGEEPAELAGLLISAIRLDLPAVCAAPSGSPFTVALTAMGLAPVFESPAKAAVDIAGSRGPRPAELIENFSLANALRAGLAAGGGPELLVHLSAIAREARSSGFPQTMQVLTPETPAIINPGSEWLDFHGTAGLLAVVGDSLHDVPTVSGPLKAALPEPPPPEVEKSHLIFIRGRASGTESVCRVSGTAREVVGECRVFDEEEAAVLTVSRGDVSASDFLVVRGCGPRGGRGLPVLRRLDDALKEAQVENVSVLTDGLAPDLACGTWASLVTPESAQGGVMGLLRDGDSLTLDLVEGRILAEIGPKELARREPVYGAALVGADYAARYARSALPAFEGAGFGTL